MMRPATLVLALACLSAAMAFNAPLVHRAAATRGGASPSAAPALRRALDVGRAVSRAGSLRLGMMSTNTGDKNAEVTLGQYTGLKVQVTKQEASEAEIAKLLKDYAKDYSLVPARFTDGDGGARMGHTVLVNFQGFDAASGQEVKGTKANMYELELKEDHKEPWKSFTKAISGGMGQDEMKSFIVDLPAEYAVSALAGKKLRFECYVKSIQQKVPKVPDSRPEAELRKEAAEQLSQKYQKVNEGMVDAAVREAIMKTCKADTSKAEAAVSWAKFGEKSTLDFQYQLIKESIGRKEGIKELDDVEKFLRQSCEIEWV